MTCAAKWRAQSQQGWWECDERSEQRTKLQLPKNNKKTHHIYLRILNMAIKFCVCFHFSTFAFFFVRLTFVMRYSSARGEEMLRKEIERSEKWEFLLTLLFAVVGDSAVAPWTTWNTTPNILLAQMVGSERGQWVIQHVSRQWQHTEVNDARMFTRRHLTVITTTRHLFWTLRRNYGVFRRRIRQRMQLEKLVYGKCKMTNTTDEKCNVRWTWCVMTWMWRWQMPETISARHSLSTSTPHNRRTSFTKLSCSFIYLPSASFSRLYGENMLHNTNNMEYVIIDRRGKKATNRVWCGTSCGLRVSLYRPLSIYLSPITLSLSLSDDK